MRDLLLPEKAFPHAAILTKTHTVGVSRLPFLASLYISAFRLQRLRQCPGHTPSTAFRHLPPNSARFSYATEGAFSVYLGAAVHRGGQRPPKGSGTNMTANSKHLFTTFFLQPLPYLVTPSGPENCQLTNSFFVGAQTIVSLLQTTQIISDVCFITDHVAYASSNKTRIV